MGAKRVKRITLQDVAQRAGVSVQTASHVLTENPTVRITDSTRERVRLAAQEVGYQPNRLAQAMKTGKTNVVAVWMPIDRVVYNHWLQLQEVGKCARNAGYEIMVIGLEARVAYGQEWKMPSQWPADGIIAIDCGRAMRRFRESSDNTEVPVLVIGHEDLPNGDNVTFDLMGAFYSITKELLSGGAQSLWHVSPNWVIENYPNEQRRTGFTKACEEAGKPGHIIPVAAETAEAVDNAFEHALKEFGPPNGITCFNDTIAVAAGGWLFRQNFGADFRCPVWGYDGLPILSALPFEVNTFRVPYHKVVAHGWDWLMERVAQPDLPTRTQVYELERVYSS